MNKKIVTAGAAALLTLLTLTGCAPASPADQARAVVEKFASAFAAGDPDAVNALECEDGRISYENEEGAKVNSHAITNVTEQSDGSFTVELEMDVEEYGNWSPRIGVKVGDDACIVYVDATGS